MSKETMNSKNVYQRILAIMADVEYIQKSEKAAKGLPYKFITHDQVTGALHKAMVQHGLVALTDVEEFVQEGNRTRVKVKVSFVNVDNPDDRYVTYSYGYGIDAQDKGPGKAISYATKMAYLKCFMLETGEDPERANIDFVPDNTNGNKPINENQVKQIEELLDVLEDGEEGKLLKWCQVDKLEKIPTNKFVLAMEALKAKIRRNGGEICR